MPKILHVITGLGVGGAERTLFNLLEAGLNDRCENHVISLRGLDHFGPQLERQGVPVHCLEMTPAMPSIAAMARLSQLSRKIDPDVIQGWMYHGNLAATWIRKRAPGRANLIWNIRQTLYDIRREKRLTRWVIRAGKSLSSGVDRVIYNSHLAKAQHEAIGYCSSRSEVIPNGFDPEKWHTQNCIGSRVRADCLIPPSSHVVGFIGRYHPMKDLPNLLRAARIFMRQESALHLILVGRNLGPDNPDLTTLHSQLPKSRCHVLGERDDIPRILKAMDVLCLSSAWGEGFPNVLGEAMASGVPCVATDVGDCARIIGNTGRVVQPGDPSALSDAVLDVLGNPDSGGLARRRIESNFTMDRMLGTYRDLYRSMTPGSG